ncbi:MAG: carbonate dehydratase [Hydrogenophilales bacterium 12-61-10]|nr:MAG: carbonate dehydratase [Hydrogenophilales bacterium 12-61-10]OYX29957.1 MAG: carbonate dehydratase [Hydrogenophilales bacterium 32-62-9]
MQTNDHPPHWHSLTASDTLIRLDASRSGLTPDAVAARHAQYGTNQLPPPQRQPAWRRLLLQFHNVLIYVLLAAGVITALLGHWLDSGVIFGVVIINALIGFIQEGRAEEALDAIRSMLSPHAIVTRAGERHEIPAEDLVPGDIVHLASGDRVPADLRLIDVKSLRVMEAALTGESLAVEKQVDAVAQDAALGDRASMAWSGTLVTYGQGTGVVTATGSATELGRISTLLATVEKLTTPLLKLMARFGQWLAGAILLLSVLIFGFGVWVRGYPASEMFLAAVGLAVAAIPEGLPAIMTITLAVGVTRMAHRRAIIRRLPAVETLGAVSVICSDKTGTLTRNEMTVQTVIGADGMFAVSGSGYAPEGGFSRDDQPIDPESQPLLQELAHAALLCNDAELRDSDAGWQLAGDPTEGALLTLAMKAGLDPHQTREALPRSDVIPFESEHRFMATLNHDHAGRGFIYLKGAPERVLALCKTQRSADGEAPLDSGYWHMRMEAAAAQGMRLLALAVRHETTTTLNFSDIEDGGFTLLAVLGLADPPREEAIQAIADCRAAGIRVKMITGDHAATALAIGTQLGLGGHSPGEGVRAVTGADIETLDDAQLRDVVAQTDIFARASPEHKLRMVEALQSLGHVTAMTGDGVNDAPALRRADVGVAMGNKGTEAAKEAAEMVLADDNFASIAHAVEEGRTVYGNLKKAIVFILPTNAAQAGMVLIAILLGITLPVTPVQILWVNMVSAVTLALALAFERPEPDAMRQPPRNPNEPLLTRFMLWRITFVTVFLVAGSLGLFLWELERGVPLEIARTAAINALVMGEIFYLFNCRRLTAAVVGWSGFTGNRAVLIAIGLLLVLQGLFTYLPAMQALFATAALDAAAWGRIVLFGVIVYGVVEIEKAVIRSNHKPDIP